MPKLVFYESVAPLLFKKEIDTKLFTASLLSFVGLVYREPACCLFQRRSRGLEKEGGSPFLVGSNS